MADEPENLTIRLLQEIRAEMKEGFEKAFGDLADMREHTKLIPKVRADILELQHEVASMRVDQGRTNELLEQILKTQQNHGARLNAIDGRLAIIEERTGLVKA